MKEIDRVPDGVHIVPSRASDYDRERIAKHIQMMNWEGRITPEEAKTRIYHVANSESWDELAKLIQDLPNLPVHTSYWREFNWDEPKYWGPVLSVTLVWSVSMIVIPEVLLATMHEYHTAMGIAIWLPFLIIGIFGALFSIIYGSIKLDEL